jgi:ubiquinone/menaquinone biosynthesis C-methylase UbiE
MNVSTYTDPEFLRKYKERVVIHKLVPFRKIIDLLAPMHGKRVLDIGCGSGELSKEMADLGARVTGVDVSKKWIGFCNATYKKSPHINFFLAAADKMPFVKNSSVDAVVANMVFLNVASPKKVAAIFKETSRVLKKGGAFIFSDLHPICIMNKDFPPIRYQTYSKKFSYFRDGDSYIAGIRLRGNEKIEFRNRHWTLETYSTLLEKAGFHIYKLSEPTYGKDSPRLLQKFKAPEYLLICCKKS